MGQQIIRQSDGLLAVFSSNVDAFIIIDATLEELVEWRAEEAATRARKDTLRELEHVLAGNPEKAYYQFTKTWDEAQQMDQKTNEAERGTST